MKYAVRFLIALALSVLPFRAVADIRITDGIADSTQPAVAVGPDQLAKVVWAEQVAGLYQVFWASVGIDGDVVAGPVQVTNGTGNCSLPRVAVDASNRSYAVWVLGSGSSARIYWARIGAAGAIEAGPTLLFISNGEYKRPDIAVTGDGTSHVVFEWGGPGLFHVKYMVLTSAGATVRSLVAGDYDILGIDKYPSVAIEPGGTIDIVWNDTYNFSNGLYLARYTPGGTRLSRGRIKNGNTITWPTIVAPLDGAQRILYQQPNAGVDRIWTFLGADTGQIVSPSPGPTRRPRLAGAAGQPTYAVWEDWSTGTSRIMAGKWDAAGTYINDHLLLSSGTAAATLPGIGTDGNGVYAVAWRDSRDGNGEIYLEWIPANGVIVTVRDRAFNVPVPNVRVVLYSGSTPRAEKYTGADGSCRFGDLPAGNYWVNGYYQHFQADETPTFQVPMEGYASRQLVISAEFEITCRIADAFNGGGLAHATVELFLAGFGLVDQRPPGADGLATFSVAEEGTYFLRARDIRWTGVGTDSLTFYAPRRSVDFAVTPAHVGVPVAVPQLELPTQVVVLVHGWTGNPCMWTAPAFPDDPGWTDALRSRGWTVINNIALPGSIADMHGLASLEDQALYLQTCTEALGVRSFHVVAHSLGGLVTRYMTERLQAGELPRIVNLVTLATPHHGTPLTNVAEALVLFLGAHFAGPSGFANAATWLISAEANFPSIRDLKPNSVALRNLNQDSAFSLDWTGSCLFDNPNAERHLALQTRYVTVTGDARAGMFVATGGLLAAVTCGENDGVVPTESARMWSGDARVHNYDASAVAQAVHHKKGAAIPGICSSVPVRSWVLDRLADPAGFSPPEMPLSGDSVARDVAPVRALGSLQIAAVPGEVRQDSFVVDACDTLRVNWTWFDGRVGVDMVAPGGGVIDSTVAAVDPSIERTFDPADRWGCYVIAHPAAGTWRLRTRDVVAASGAQQAYLWLQGGATSYLSLAIDGAGPEPAAARIVKATFLTAGDGPHVGAEVTARVTGPSGNSDTLVLADDGTAPDDVPGDGVYCALVTPEAAVGTTVVAVEAVAPGPIPTRRTLMRSFEVGNTADIQILEPGLAATSATGLGGTPVELSATIRNGGLLPAAVEVTFWLAEPPITLAVDTLTVSAATSLVVEAGHLPLRPRAYEYHVRARPLGDVAEAAWENNTSTHTLVIGMAATGVPTGEGAEISRLDPARELNGRRAVIASACPNPFNPRVTVRFAVAAEGHVRLSVYDLRGRLVRNLVNGRLERAVHEATWDGTTESGTAAASGVYLLRLDGAGALDHRKVTLVR